MQRKIVMVSIGIAGIAALVASGYGLYGFGMRRGAEMARGAGDATALDASAPGTPTGVIDPATGRRVLYWHDPMVPGARFDQPGKSPFMDMMLVPVYVDDADEGGVSVSPRVRQNLGVRTVEVVRETVVPRVEAAGNVAFNERDQVVVEARAIAYVERLNVRATLDHVAAGQALAELYVPDWVAAQEELLAVKRMQGGGLGALVDGARRRMRQAGMTDEQIRLVEESGELQPRITLTAPIDGVVVELGAREGMTVMPGETLFRINGLKTVWVHAEVPESQAALLGPGAAVEARSAALPGTVFTGAVQAILPEVDPATRTIKARVELANPGAELAPGMFVGVALATGAQQALTVPTEAVIRTGRRAVVILEEDGAFHPVDVELGVEAGGRTEIKRGLEAGQRVVASGQFLIDSEASLRATSVRMQEMPSTERGDDR